MFESGSRNGPTYGTEFDVVVIGAGAGGLNAALVLARSRRRVAVVDSGAPRNAPAAHMQGFLSRDGMPPAELLETGRAEAAGYGVEFLDGEVEEVARIFEEGAPVFTVRLADGVVLAARRVVVATGLRDELPDIPGVADRWGRDLLHCPYCHGYEVREQTLGVLGTQPAAVRHALLIRQWSEDVVLFRHTLEITGEDREALDARGVTVVDGTVERLLVEGDRLRGVQLAEGSCVPCHALFLVPRMVPRDGLLTALGCERGDNGWVATDRTGRTSVPGVWAVGNVVDPRALVVSAAGAGSAAAFAINHDLVGEDVEQAVQDHRMVKELTGVRPGDEY
ncbi:NAD(P)/FAD-dependent oxidoreductase [Nocardiopsis exhalans]|uniref:NAD(P)/FAD-dependent oxidoreductase n=1 Tax=Nocardiopsis exhalans TaxID=163604 RepID=A0ABY5D8J2_9ACTN|nr:NAD(P)/FAD-dependent oxidoreductase [Nocardiopsis exhalans]USY20671.1 NAD(P)/FAD-dependent oxidoreductase [Nocardiopsis exhalans]